MARVVVIGSANVDLTVRVDRLPKTGETVSGGEFYTAFGGKGANQAVAALRAGAEVRFVAKVGGDANGEAIVANLASLGLATQWITRDPVAHSGVALILVDARGQNQIAVAPGANRRLTVDEVRFQEASIAWGEILLIQLEVPLPAVAEALRLAKTHGVRTILNPAPAQPLSGEILSLVDFLTPNEGEAEALAGVSVQDGHALIRACQGLRGLGARSVVVTLGDQGALLVDEEGRDVHFPSFRVEAVDSTAAGDAFNGVVACALAGQMPVNEAIQWANAAGALCVTRRGAQGAIPTREEIETLVEKARVNAEP